MQRERVPVHWCWPSPMDGERKSRQTPEAGEPVRQSSIRLTPECRLNPHEPTDTVSKSGEELNLLLEECQAVDAGTP